MKLSTKRANQKGFTLVELAIVLVIIGLIVGGVLAGQDLIKGAKLQKGIKMLTDTDTAMTTFYNKYGANAGDYGNPSSFTSPTSLSAITAGTAWGDGNGSIDGASSATAVAATTGLSATGEVALVFAELYDNGLVAGPITGPTSTTPVTAIVTTQFPTFPAAPAGTNKILEIVQTFGGVNYMHLVGAASGATITNGILTTSAGLSPQQAQSIDSKQDDGSPSTGNVVSIAVGATSVGGTVNTGSNCMASTTATVYASGATSQYCNISVKGSF